MAKTLVVLGASSDQLFLIRTAQHLGFFVLALDMNPQSVGFSVADAYAVISTRDVPAICRFLDEYRRNGQEIAGVITMGSDIPDVVAEVSHYLGTPSISRLTARWATNKYEMKLRFQMMGVPIPWFKKIQTMEELKAVIADRGFPLVLKPIDRSGSRGVFLLADGCDVEDLFTKSRDFSYAGVCMVEEYLAGLQISTETVMFQGRGVTPGFADRNYEYLDHFLPQIMENGGWVPSVVTPEQRTAVEDLIVKASLALGVVDGITKGDVVLTSEGPKIIEMAARLSGGDFCESLVPIGSGINYVEAAVCLATGQLPDLSKLQPVCDVAVANRYFFPPSGQLVRVEGADEVREKPWVKKLEFWYQPGDNVPPPLSHAHRFGVFLVTAPNRQELERRVAWVYETIRIVTA
ncbi:MAG TPA: ATP-grasp domain-containing protein [Patescibacteria group bacterium]|nr:ATP-grasp domain-containing protein [Patescibacteria group bacterium]